MSDFKEPITDIAQLAHVEMFTPKLDESVAFFHDLLGLEITERDGDSVYMRAYEDPYHHSLILTAADEPGLGHMSWRTSSPQALERRVKSLESTNLGIGWVENQKGHGRAYQFHNTDGHVNEIFWEAEYVQVAEGERSTLLNRPQRRPLHGVPARRIDHINLLCSDPKAMREFYEEHLGFRLREGVRAENDTVEVANWMSVTPLVHELAFMQDPTPHKGRLHHLCYWWGSPQHLADLADIFREHDIPIEAGPGKHGITQALYMYVFEPGGNRVELFGDSGYLILDPDWQPVLWRDEQIADGIFWYGGSLPEEFFLYGTPVAKTDEQAEQGEEEAEEAAEALVSSGDD